MPDWTCGVNDMLCRKTAAAGENCLTHSTGTNAVTFSLHCFNTGCSEDGAADATTHPHLRVGRIDDGVDLHGGDISPDYLKRHEDGSPFFYHYTTHVFSVHGSSHADSLVPVLHVRYDERRNGLTGFSPIEDGWREMKWI